MAKLNKLSVIFPLSNPVSLCEVDFSDAVTWTNGNVVFASGSPYQAFEYQGKKYEPGQGNNMYIFPGIGLGAILSKSRHVSDQMVEQASIALSNSLNEEEIAAGLVYPRLTRIREISAQIALAVIRKSQEENLDEHRSLRRLDDKTLLDYIKSKQWHPIAAEEESHL